jgi:hypothetical protein
MRKGDWIRSRLEPGTIGIVSWIGPDGELKAGMWKEGLRKFEPWYTHKNIVQPLDPSELSEEAVAAWMLRELSR